MEISEFFKNEFKDFSLYSSFRGIANAIDGCKPSTRKLIYTIDKKNVTQNVKVANVAASTAEFTSYLHGATSLEGACVGLAQDFANNCNLLDPEGNFGNRLNHEAAASRYIFTKKSKWFDLILNDADKRIIKYRSFEGEDIEPYFYVPVVPLLLINGSSGIGSGYAQKILPRKLSDIIDAIEKLISDKKVKSIVPSLNCFNGVINSLGDNKVEILGTIEKGDAKIVITEVPFSYDLVSYLKELDNLEELGIIKSYKDLSENGKFLFEVKCTREFASQSNEKILSDLKLIDRQTENFTCISENDSIIVFKDEIDLLKYFIKLRLKYYDKRKEYLLKDFETQCLVLKNRIRFLKEIMSEKLVIYKKSKTDVQELLTKGKYDLIDNSYEYLLSMKIDSFTTEKYKKFEDELLEITKEYESLKEKTNKDLWVNDLKLLKKVV